MNKKLWGAFLVLLFLLSFNSVSLANLIFKMEADKYTLGIGDTAIIGISAKIEEEPSGTNGINLWQLDMIADYDKVTVTDVEVVEPSPLDPLLGEYVYVNRDPADPENVVFDGNILGLGGGLDGAFAPTTVGVGGFTLLANITIQGLSLGTVEYSLTDAYTTGFYAYLADMTYYDIDNGDITFQQGNNVFEVVPEPSSLVIMTIMAGLALRRRKTSVVR